MLFALLALLGSLASDSVSYASPEAWLCRPGRADACAVDLTTTVVAPDGKLTTEPWAANPKVTIDCFYVYPTVSRDSTNHSDMVAGDEERNVIRQQFARFASVCRPYAPLYRQLSLAGLRRVMSTPDGGGLSLRTGTNYDDVLAAWRYYLAHDNRGRGVVLIGHSQGAMLLEELIKHEIDRKPVLARIVSAILLGSTVAVPRGKDVGGAFQSLPLCRNANQTGCVVAFASFRRTVPPAPRALFGHVAGEGMEAACTNPVALGGGSGGLHAYLTTSGPLIASADRQPHKWTATAASIETPFVSVPGLLSAECVSDAAGSRLDVSLHADAADVRADDIPGDIAPGTPVQAQWGLHLIDVNLVQGDLIDLVRRQASGFRSAKR